MEHNGRNTPTFCSACESVQFVVSLVLGSTSLTGGSDRDRERARIGYVGQLALFRCRVVFMPYLYYIKYQRQPMIY